MNMSQEFQHDLYSIFFMVLCCQSKWYFIVLFPLLNCISIVLVFLDSHFHLQALDQLPVVFKFGYSEEKTL